MLITMPFMQYWINWSLLPIKTKPLLQQQSLPTAITETISPLTAAKNGLISQLKNEIVNSENKDLTCRQGYSLLHHSAMHGHHHCVKYLLDIGADANSKANGGITPLHRAVSFGCIETTSQLIKGGANIHAADCNGHTPLHAAARFGHTAIVHFLISLGANIHATDAANYTPLDEAIKYRQRDTITVLLDA